MRIRDMNMERIRQLHQMNTSANTNTNNYPYNNTNTPTTTSSTRHSGLSAIEQDLLGLASFDVPLPSYNASGYTTQDAAPTSISIRVSKFLLLPPTFFLYSFLLQLFDHA
jgi:hypothetical protein